VNEVRLGWVDSRAGGKKAGSAQDGTFDTALQWRESPWHEGEKKEKDSHKQRKAESRSGGVLSKIRGFVRFTTRSKVKVKVQRTSVGAN